MNFFKIAWRDISSIFKNRFIRASVTAIIIVPLLYSLLYLDAFWDPYSKLDKLPVAVVNMDTGGVNNGRNVNYGEDLVKNLRSSNKIGFKFVTKAEAEKGLKAQKGYYSMFLIPESFSKDILKVNGGKPKVANIYYTSNDKKSFLASQINGKLILEIKKELTKNIVSEDTKIIFDNLYEIKNSLKLAEDGSKKLYDNLKTAEDGSTTLSNGLLTLNNNVPQLKTGVKDLNTGTGTLANALGTTQLYVGQLYDGSLQLNDGLGKLAQQVPVLSSGVNQLYTGSSDLNNGLKTAKEGLINKILPGSQALTDGINQLSNGLLGAEEGTDKLVKGAGNLKTAVGTTDTQNSLLNAAGALSAGATKIKAGTDQLKPALAQVVKGADSVKTASAQVAGGVDALITSVSTSQEALKNAVTTQLGAYLKANPTAMADVNMQKFVATITALNTAATDTAKLSQVAALQTGAHQLATGAGDLSKGLTTLGAGIGVFADSSIQYAAGASQYAGGANQFASGANQFATGAGTLANGLADAVKGAKTLSTGATALNGALKGELAGGLSALNTGAAKLNLGLNALNSNIPQLKAAVSKLYEGSTAIKNNIGNNKDRAELPTILNPPPSTVTLLNGVNSLHDGAVKLNNGLTTLNGKIPDLEEGTKKFYNGSVDLKSGLSKLTDGSKELWQKLKDGHQKITNNLKASSSDMAEYISKPVDINEGAINAVKNYGTGFTPYFIPLSLWVGAMLMFFVISDKVDEDIKANSISLVLGKFISYGYIGVIQAVLASTVVLLLGLRPTSVIAYFGFNILMSLSFIAIIQSLVFLLGQLGRLIGIALLILQLTSCAGTFPIEIVPKFFRVINPFMPFTYCVSGMREIISGIDHVVLAQDCTVLGIFMVVFIFISIVMKKHADKVKVAIEQRKQA